MTSSQPTIATELISNDARRYPTSVQVTVTTGTSSSETLDDTERIRTAVRSVQAIQDLNYDAKVLSNTLIRSCAWRGQFGTSDLASGAYCS